MKTGSVGFCGRRISAGQIRVRLVRSEFGLRNIKIDFAIEHTSILRSTLRDILERYCHIWSIDERDNYFTIFKFK